MLISEVMSELQAIADRFGDVEVRATDDQGTSCTPDITPPSSHTPYVVITG